MPEISQELYDALVARTQGAITSDALDRLADAEVAPWRHVLAALPDNWKLEDQGDDGYICVTNGMRGICMHCVGQDPERAVAAILFLAGETE